MGETTDTTLQWLLDSDPAIRWQVKRDLLGAPEAEVAAERDRVAREGWGARLLAFQGPDGQWGTQGYEPLRDPAVVPDAADRRRLLDAQMISAAEAAEFIDTDEATVERLNEDPIDPSDPVTGRYLWLIAWAQRTLGTYQPKWTSTTYTLLLLRHLGADPKDPVVRRALERVAGNVKWDTGTGDVWDFFEGETEVCVNGMVAAIGSYFGHDVDSLIDRLLGQRLDDGGWNCAIEYGSVRSSFNTTLSVLEALHEYEGTHGPKPEVAAAREAGEEYLLQRGLMRSLSTGEVIKPQWTQFSFPPRWHYDVLRGLDYMRAAGRRDSRCQEAVDLVARKRDADGRWALENSHRGDVYFDIDDGDGQPSRWNTLRALRVLEWFGA